MLDGRFEEIPPKVQFEEKRSHSVGWKVQFEDIPQSPLTCLDSANEGLAEVPPIH